MKTRILLFTLACFAFAVLAYFWATGMLSSLEAYRSPLAGTPPAAGQVANQPLARRVVFVLIDALRYDTSMKAEVMPFLNQLRSQGASAIMHSRPPSYSQPGYSVLLTGAWPELSDGPAMNLDYGLIPTFTQDNLFSAAHRARLKTAISGFNWFEKLVPQDAVDASFYTPGEDEAADRQVVDAALPWLASGQYQFVLVHIDQVDYAGHHQGGPRDPNWDAASRRADGLLAEIAGQLDLNRDVLFVCSDHGQIDQGGHGGQDPITLLEPFVIAGSGIKPGQYPDVNMVDVAPTLAALLGANIPATSQGRVRTEMLNLSQADVQSIQNAEAAQQSQLAGLYGAAIGRSVNVSPGNDPVTSVQTAMEAARDARLTSERIPRLILAFLLAILPPALLLFAWRRSPAHWKTEAWLVAGGLVFIALFNLRYAVLSQNTYSLSSVTGATDLIIYCAVTSAIALLIAWLGVTLLTGAFRQGPAPAAQLTLGLALTTIYLLFLPILWSFAWNGALITWTMPDFLSLFLAFLSLLQVLFVGVLGILLAGIAALASFFMARRLSAAGRERPALD